MLEKVIKPFMVIAFAPLALWDYIKKHKLVCIVATIIIMFITLPFCCTCNKKHDNSDCIIDCTFSFNTGEKRNSPTNYIILHHIAGTAKISDIAKTHYKQNGWNGIGYHYFIDFDGKIYNLRSEDERAPHTYGHNSDAVAICFNGNLSQVEPTKEQWESGLYLVRKLMNKYNLGKNNVMKHCDFNTTECCGKKFDKQKFKNEL